MNLSLLSFLSGPLMALLRYAITAGGAAVVAKGWADGATASTVGAGILAAVSAAVGILTQTKPAKVAAVADFPGYSVNTPAGVANNAHEAAALTK